MNRLSGAIHVELASSRKLCRATYVLHFVIVVICVFCPIHWLLMSVITAATGCSLGRCLYAMYADRADRVQAILLQSNGHWKVETRHHPFVLARLEASYYVSPSLTVLPFRTEDGRRRIAVLLDDNVNADTYRRLRVRLYWSKSA